MTAFEGKTGPYLLYQVVRIRSLLRKALDQGFEPGLLHVSEDDRSLCLLLGEYLDHFSLALENYTPHVLCDYAYKLAQEFSSFYGRCHIISEDDETIRASRLRLCVMVADRLTEVLDLLGITVPERM